MYVMYIRMNTFAYFVYVRKKECAPHSLRLYRNIFGTSHRTLISECAGRVDGCFVVIDQLDRVCEVTVVVCALLWCTRHAFGMFRSCNVCVHAHVMTLEYRIRTILWLYFLTTGPAST